MKRSSSLLVERLFLREQAFCLRSSAMLRLRSFVPVVDICVSRLTCSGAVQIKSGMRNMSVTPIRPHFPAELVAPEIERSVSLATASAKELLKYKKGLAVKKQQAHITDTGSASVQIACMTEKIIALTAHFAKHKKDMAGKRGYQMLLAKRNRMMQYLMVTDIKEFGRVIDSLNLVKEARHLRRA